MLDCCHHRGSCDSAEWCYSHVQPGCCSLVAAVNIAGRASCAPASVAECTWYISGVPSGSFSCSLAIPTLCRMTGCRSPAHALHAACKHAAWRQ